MLDNKNYRTHPTIFKNNANNFAVIKVKSIQGLEQH